uniref:Uncharacterized protein n=1 Tax=Mycena chlorophos TaxID=658473 RepID=A0ABQ0LFR3_MYCCL|nr:predicted protein [Mycena chlorophos]
MAVESHASASCSLPPCRRLWRQWPSRPVILVEPTVAWANPSPSSLGFDEHGELVVVAMSKLHCSTLFPVLVHCRLQEGSIPLGDKPGALPRAVGAILMRMRSPKPHITPLATQFARRWAVHDVWRRESGRDDHVLCGQCPASGRDLFASLSTASRLDSLRGKRECLALDHLAIRHSLRPRAVCGTGRTSQVVLYSASAFGRTGRAPQSLRVWLA